MASKSPGRLETPAARPGGRSLCRRSVSIAVVSALVITVVVAICMLGLTGDMAARRVVDTPLTGESRVRVDASAPEARRDGAPRDATESELRAPVALIPTAVSASADSVFELTGLTLTGVAELEGTVWTGDGTPVAGCRVRLTTTREPAVFAQTDHEGGFRFDKLASGGGYRLRVTPPAGFEEEVVALVLEPGSRHIDIALREKGVGQLRLALIDTDGEPLKNRILTVRRATGTVPTRGVTDSEGRLALEVPSGSLVIESLAPPTLTVSGLVVKPGEALDALVTAALGAYSVDGVVAEAGGAALVGVRVTATWTRRDGDIRSSIVHSVRTDGSGRFTLRGFGAGIFEFSAVATGYQRARAMLRVPVDRELRLDLPPIK